MALRACVGVGYLGLGWGGGEGGCVELGFHSDVYDRKCCVLYN